MKHIKFISLLSIALCLPQISLAMEQNSQGHYEQLQNCSVCFESLYPCQNIKIIACGHIFHSACIEPWLAESSVCPLCRKDVVSGMPAPVSLQYRSDNSEADYTASEERDQSSSASEFESEEEADSTTYSGVGHQSFRDMCDNYMDARDSVQESKCLAETLIVFAEESSEDDFNRALGDLLNNREFLGKDFFERTIAQALKAADAGKNTFALQQLIPIARSIGLLESAQ